MRRCLKTFRDGIRKFRANLRFPAMENVVYYSIPSLFCLYWDVRKIAVLSIYSMDIFFVTKCTARLYEHYLGRASGNTARVEEFDW